MNWICCQLGAREHYAVARALNQVGALRELLTDLWVRPQSLLAKCGGARLRERFHPDLTNASVREWNVGLVAFELAARVKRLSGWPLILARNHWFQRHVVRQLSSVFHLPSSPEMPTLFSYSYTALEPFRFAKSRGWRTVLGQIDAGPEMGRIVQHLEQRHPAYQSRSDAPPKHYWEAWHDECAFADRIIVNSEWSRKALAMEGISAGKIHVIPLAYAPPAEARAFQREYPPVFTAQRPMRVLFLGQVNLLKGLLPLLEAADMLKGEPVEFQIVGPVQVAVPERWRHHPQIRWRGPVPRGTVAEHYRAADVFVFPTFSDGFGLTQLEAQAWKLPVIASHFCGAVVKDDVNGMLLKEVSAGAIASALRRLLDEPGLLRSLAEHSGVGPQFSLAGIATALQRVLD